MPTNPTTKNPNMKIIRWSSAAGFSFLLLVTFSLFGMTAEGQSSGFATNTPMVTEVAADASQLTMTPAAPVESAEIVEPTATVEAVIEDSGSTFLPAQVSYFEECAYVEGQPTSQACIDRMNAYPDPNVTEIRPDGYTLEQYSFWRVGPQAVNTYDAPGGSVIGQIPQGFNFVNAVNTQEGWIQSESGQWISMNDGYYVEPSFWRGMLLPEDWSLPFGWVLDMTGIWASTYPGGPATSESGLVPLRHEMYNIYAAAYDADGWRWYLVGPNQWVKQIYMTVIKPIEKPESVSGRWVAVDLFEQSLIAYEGDRPVFATMISSGLPGTETNEGTFDIWARVARDGMSGATGAPDAYALESVPWVMYFDGGISLHGTYWHDLFGYRRSHGCVNLSISDARWVFEWTGQSEPNAEGEIVNQVYVYSSGEYRKPA